MRDTWDRGLQQQYVLLHATYLPPFLSPFPSGEYELENMYGISPDCCSHLVPVNMYAHVTSHQLTYG